MYAEDTLCLRVLAQSPYARTRCACACLHNLHMQGHAVLACACTHPHQCFQSPRIPIGAFNLHASPSMAMSVLRCCWHMLEMPCRSSRGRCRPPKERQVCAAAGKYSFARWVQDACLASLPRAQASCRLSNFVSTGKAPCGASLHWARQGSGLCLVRGRLHDVFE